MDVYSFDTRYQHPFSMIVAGASGTGKTHFVKNLLEPGRVTPPFTEVWWFYTEWQPAYEHFPRHVKFFRGLPDSFDQFESTTSRCMVFDDLMVECSTNDAVRELFLQKRHHANMSVILILQNLFCQGKEMRNIHLNTQYVVVFPTPRDKSQFGFVARQVEPQRTKFLTSAYEQATSEPYEHFLLDFKPHTPDPLRYRSDTFDKNYVYVPSKVLNRRARRNNPLRRG